MVWERCEFSYVDAQKTNGIWHERWHIYVSSNIWREAALGNQNTSRFGIIWSHSVVLLHWRLEFSFILISFIVRTRWVFDWFFLSANRPESVLCRRYKRSSSSSNNFNGDICDHLVDIINYFYGQIIQIKWSFFDGIFGSQMSLAGQKYGVMMELYFPDWKDPLRSIRISFSSENLIRRRRI